MVLTVKFALFCPERMVTVEGIEAATLSLFIETTTPDGPAFPVNETVPIELVPPVTDVGFTDTDAILVAVMVNVADS